MVLSGFECKVVVLYELAVDVVGATRSAQSKS
jgi:hypothetical protein